MSREERQREREKERKKREKREKGREREQKRHEVAKRNWERCGVVHAMRYAVRPSRRGRAARYSPAPAGLASPHLVSPRLASPRLASPRFASPCLASPRLASPRLVSPHLVLARRGAARLGAVCHAAVLPADIFIGGRTTCDRLRGIRTDAVFCPFVSPVSPPGRSNDSPVYPFSLSIAAALPTPPLPPSRGPLSSALASLAPPSRPIRGRYHRGAARRGGTPLKRRRVTPLDADQRGPARKDDILAVG